MPLIKKSAASLVETFGGEKKKMKESSAKWQPSGVNSSEEFCF